MNEHYQLYDLHCHLDWCADAASVAHEAAEQGLAIVDATVTPAGCVTAESTLADAANVVVGVGLHPWWVADGRCGENDTMLAAELVARRRVVGEVGLDFSGAHVPPGSEEQQVRALKHVLAACDANARENGPKLISLHAVRSADTVLDLLDRTGCLRSCHCVFHWFSGTGNELTRAVRAGCWFSVNEMMLATRRGREYARQLPARQVLLETDLPPRKGAVCTANDIRASLERVLVTLRERRKADVREVIAENSRQLLGI